jgi:hypothetical protein
MADIDMNEVMLKYLFECPTVKANPMFFNFVQSKENSQQFVTSSNTTIKKYVDGSSWKRYQFTLFVYKSLSYLPVVKEEGYPNENVTEVAELQGIIDWIHEQADDENYPDFGTGIVVDSMETVATNPVLYGTDVSVSPPLAKYGMTVKIDYLDTLKRVWNKEGE